MSYKGNTTIGNDIWIGKNVTTLPGIKIGDRPIIAANLVVTKNLAPYSMVGGNPAKFIKKRFEDNLIDYLLKIQWWDWSKEKIFSNLEILCSSDLENIQNIK